MPSTNKTANYALSQFSAGDKPSFLRDYNSDMATIDAQMKKNADAAASGGHVDAYTKAQSDARYAPKTTTPPDDTALGVTAGDFDRLYIDSDNIVRFKPKTA
jgi:hypothetical protein